MRWLFWFGAVTSIVVGVGSAAAATLQVGPGKAHVAPCSAFAAAQDGDTVLVDAAGDYAGDVCAIVKNGLQIRAVGVGRARIDAAGKSSQGKAIWVVQGDDTTIEGIEFSGAKVADANGAGIRQEGKNLTVRHCYFHDNENGVLAGDVAGSEILIEHSEFDHNGAGDGYSHNLYVNHVAKLTFQYNYSHRAVVGHLIKTRAAENRILYNRLSGESDGTQSYELDCPNGGKTYVIGNLIEQGTSTGNPALVAYLEEGSHPQNPSDALFVINNSFVNRLGRGAFVNVGAAAATPAVLTNNVFFGGGALCSQASALLSHNYDGQASCFVDDASLDLRLLEGSPCVDAGVDPGSDAGFSLVPSSHYVHPTASEARAVSGLLDLGAFELTTTATGGAATTGGNSGGGRTGAGTGGQAATAGGTGASSGGTGASSGGANASSGGSTGSAGVAGAAASDSSGSGCTCRLSRPRSENRALAIGLYCLGALLLTRRRTSDAKG